MSSPASVQQVTFAWWNTGLSPSVKQNRAEPEELAIAAGMVKFFIDSSVDVIALCEVADKDIDYLLDHAPLAEYAAVRAMNRAGHGLFDVCVFYRKSVMAFGDVHDLKVNINGSTIRLGQQFLFALPGEKRPLHVIASHWPSVKTLQQLDPDRHRLGDRLREKVDGLLEADADAHLVLMGDYNDEPFDYSISNRLLGARDPAFVAHRPALLLNPFWRHMSPFGCDDPARHSDRGTYFHIGGVVTRWRTYDHMMFSSAFVTGKGGWRLDERSARVVEVPTYTDLVIARKHVFDHLPIVARIFRSGS
jgi:exonuclease III